MYRKARRKREKQISFSPFLGSQLSGTVIPYTGVLVPQFFLRRPNFLTPPVSLLLLAFNSSDPYTRPVSFPPPLGTLIHAHTHTHTPNFWPSEHSTNILFEYEAKFCSFSLFLGCGSSIWRRTKRDEVRLNSKLSPYLFLAPRFAYTRIIEHGGWCPPKPSFFREFFLARSREPGFLIFSLRPKLISRRPFSLSLPRIYYAEISRDGRVGEKTSVQGIFGLFCVYGAYVYFRTIKEEKITQVKRDVQRERVEVVLFYGRDVLYVKEYI